MAFDIAEMLEKAEGSDGSDKPEVDASLTPDDKPVDEADKPTNEGQPDVDPGAESAVPGASGEDANTTDEPELPEEPPATQNEPANIAQVRSWGKAWEKDAKAARQRFEDKEKHGDGFADSLKQSQKYRQLQGSTNSRMMASE